ncbi:hypothetical protein BYT27DRAFT_7258069 [Phlegmacium glaucopus]|nr:hypothetical protein BYT27DRAFT_7258069 [Phlegmacium glaucopus]
MGFAVPQNGNDRAWYRCQFHGHRWSQLRERWIVVSLGTIGAFVLYTMNGSVVCPDLVASDVPNQMVPAPPALGSTLKVIAVPPVVFKLPTSPILSRGR